VLRPASDYRLGEFAAASLKRSALAQKAFGTGPAEVEDVEQAQSSY
jgi:hypothetical protein